MFRLWPGLILLLKGSASVLLILSLSAAILPTITMIGITTKTTRDLGLLRTRMIMSMSGKILTAITGHICIDLTVMSIAIVTATVRGEAVRDLNIGCLVADEIFCFCAAFVGFYSFR